MERPPSQGGGQPRQNAGDANDPEFANRFPLLLTPEQAAQLLQVPLGTIYSWSSAGRLDVCKRRLGRHVRFLPERLLKLVIDGGIK